MRNVQSNGPCLTTTATIEGNGTVAHSRLLVMGEDVEHLMDPYCEHDPDAIRQRWDYYEIGGRFDTALLKRSGERASSARVREVDMDGMRERAAAVAETTWTDYQRVLDEHGPAKSWSACLEAAGGDQSHARQRYHEQPTIRHLWQILPWGISPDTFFEGGHEAFVHRARLAAIPGPHMLTPQDGWIEAGRIDLWGGSNATGQSRHAYLLRANARLDEASGAELLTVVDYHT